MYYIQLINRLFLLPINKHVGERVCQYVSSTRCFVNLMSDNTVTVLCKVAN